MHGRGRETFANGECFIVYYKNGYKLEALASKTMSYLSVSRDNEQPSSLNSSSITTQGSVATKSDLTSSFANGGNNNSAGSLISGYITNSKKRNNNGGDANIVSNKNLSKSVLGGNSSVDDDLYQNSGKDKDKKGGNKGF